MADKVSEAVKSVLNGEAKEPKKKFKLGEIRIRKGATRGYIASHHMEDEEGYERGKPQVHPHVSFDDLVEHLRKHMGEEAAEIKAEKKGGNAEPQDEAE